MTRRNFLAVAAAAAGAPAGTALGIAADSFPSRRPKSVYEFLEYCHSLGAAGAQAPLGSLEPESISKVRRRAEELGMYVEISTSLPKDDAVAFERSVKAAKEAGALCLRAACLGGRRYEVFSNLEDWKRFVADAKLRIARAVPVLERHRLPLGIENHKDWTAEEMVALMREYSSEYLGVCLDTGNNISLLDDPMELVESLAPYAAATHLKDMTVEEYPEGFLLAEVPFGEGVLDLRRIVSTISKARPRTKFTLEMITRNPLRIPCLTPKYWATFAGRNGSYLARTLTMVRAHLPRQPMPQPESLALAARVQLEEDNVKRCLAYARERLGLVGRAI